MKKVNLKKEKEKKEKLIFKNKCILNIKYDVKKEEIRRVVWFKKKK